MNHKILLVAFATLSVSFTGCNEEKYNREDGCDLELMQLNGNVVKVETITQSSIPVTELFANAFDPSHMFSMFAGNTTIELDNHGNIKHETGYGIDGEIIFDIRDIHLDKDSKTTPGLIIGPDVNETIDKVKTISSDMGNNVETNYYNGEDLVWKLKATYNDDGTINTIIKEYVKYKTNNDIINKLYTDTTNFYYLSYDSLANWTEVEVDYKGILPSHKHSFKIKRQITYANNKNKEELIKQLSDYNKMQSVRTSDFVVKSLGKYGTISIPHYMALRTQEQIQEVKSQVNAPFKEQTKYYFRSVYDNNDAYATLSANSVYNNQAESLENVSATELEYNVETDKYFEKLNRQVLAQNGSYILKWLPYQFTTISGHIALKLHYYRYGIVSPIPVYYESYTIPMNDGYTLVFSFSYQSNLQYRFEEDFNKAIKSINLIP